MQWQLRQGNEGESTTRREAARRSVLRANRAVAAVLLVTFLLSVAIVAAGYRAHQSKRRAEKAEQQATERLWSSCLAQARAERLSAVAGHRSAALAAISNAAAIRPSIELRDEAIASFALRDLVPDVAWPLKPGAYGFHFDPQLEHYVVRYTSGELSMFRLKDNVLVRTFRAEDAGLGTNAVLREFFFSRTGRYLAMQYSGGAVVLWERDSGRVAHVFGRDANSERLAWALNFTADDERILARSASQSSRLLFIELPSEERREFSVPGMNDSIRLSPSGAVFTWFRGTNIFFHDAQSGTLLRKLSAPAEVEALWWDMKGDQFSISCRDSSVHVWDSRTDRLRQFGGRVVNAWMQQFSPDGALLVTAGSDGTSRLWDVSDARLIAQTSGGRAFVFGRDGERVAYGTPGREVGVWRITQPLGHRLLQGAVSEYATVWHQDLSPDGKWAVWSPPPWVPRRGFELFDLASNRPPLWVSTPRDVMAGFHPTEPLLFVAGRDGLRKFKLPEAGKPLQLDSGSPVALPEGFEPRGFALSGNGRQAVAMSVAGQFVVLDLEQPGKFVPLEGRFARREFPGPASLTGAGTIAMSMDGRWVVAGMGERDGSPTIWNATTGKVVRRLPTSTSHVAFSPDGRLLVTVSLTSCTLWTVGSWEERWKKPRAAMLSTAGFSAFTPDGSWLAYSRSIDEVELVKPSTGEHVATLGGPMLFSITGLRLAADGNTLGIASSAGRIHFWDLRILRSRLAEFRLDWGTDATSAPPPARPVQGPVMSSTMLAGVGVGTVAVTGLLGVVVLRRHGRLTRDFMQTTEVASRQERELAAERELNELKSRFVSMVSHEFRTPLGITMSAVELMRNYADRLPREKLEELLSDIYSSTLRMSGLMEQVLFLGRVEARKIDFKKSPIDLATFGGKLVDETMSSTSRRCPVKFRAEGDLGGAAGDESLVHHILSNLLSNAVKYSRDAGEVELGIRREGRDAIFTVKDHGIGIPVADRARLFEAFHRASNVGQVAGTGLGLLIVKRCVELLEGSISFASLENEGTTFTVRVPLFAAA